MRAGLHVLGAHQVEEQPRTDRLQSLLGGGLRERLLLREGLAAHPRHVRPHELRHLRRHLQADRLAGADAAHAERALRKVAEGHVLAERHRRAGRECLLDVDARRVHLVEEGEAARRGDAAALELKHLISANLGVLSGALGNPLRRRSLEHLEPGAQQDHLAVSLVEEYDALDAVEPSREEVPRDLHDDESVSDQLVD